MDSSQEEWNLTLEVYAKFQLKRKPQGLSGAASLTKNILKLLSQCNIEKNNDIMDQIIGDSLEYLRMIMWTSETYIGYPEEARFGVLDDAVTVFESIKNAHLTA
jgi:hypothetical protein